MTSCPRIKSSGTYIQIYSADDVCVFEGKLEYEPTPETFCLFSSVIMDAYSKGWNDREKVLICEAQHKRPFENRFVEGVTSDADYAGRQSGRSFPGKRQV